jgi:putative ABC transport system substrate-binding protein
MTRTPLLKLFIMLFGSTTAAWPVGAQTPANPVVGFLSSRSPAESAHLVAAFRKGLEEIGFVEAKGLKIEFRWAEGQNDRLPALADDLARLQVAVIAGANSTAVVRAAKTATATIPIVFAIGADPVKVGLVASLSQPGGNITGLSYLTNQLIPKRMELLSELLPKTAMIGVLVNPNNPNTESDWRDAETAAGVLGRTLRRVATGTASELGPAFAALAQQGITALFVNTDPLFTVHRDQIVALAARHGIPTAYDRREFAAIGGLISYGADQTEDYRQMGRYTGRILKGEKPSDLPVQQAAKIELIINLKSAKSLGLTVSPTLLARADEVIE